MNINILRYPLFGIAGGQEIDRNFSKKYCRVFIKTDITFKESSLNTVHSNFIIALHTYNFV